MIYSIILILVLFPAISKSDDVVLTNENGLLHIENGHNPNFQLDIPDGENHLLIKKQQQIDAINANRTIPRRTGYSRTSNRISEAEPVGGDLKLTDEQRDLLFPDRSGMGNRTKRSGTETVARLWTGGRIPYRFDLKQFNKYDMADIEMAMKIWEQETCIDFVPWNQQQHGVNHILLKGDHDGCWSRLGMVNLGAQTVNLQDPGCRQMGTYLHELGHSIGLVHEHQMPNRDAFLRYYYVNVDPNEEDQLMLYDKNAVKDYGSQYDLSSIMHYELNAFSIDEVSLTLAVNNPWYFQYIGRRHSNILSFGDVRIVNKLYNCSHKCKVTDWKDCYAPAFVNHRCECVTPQSYYGRVCRNEADIEAQCYDMARRGECDVESPEHHLYCAKACDFCPRLLPGVSGLTVPNPACQNVYVSNQMCELWAKNGDCQRFSKFMHRYCRLSCKACASPIGRCPNYESNIDCDNRLKYCKAQGDMFKMVRYMCQDTCGTCGKRPEGDCSNKISDDQCIKRAESYGCEVDFFRMFVECPKTCNRCWYNSGNCANKHANEQECLRWAVMNRCQGGDYHESVVAWCQKTCGTC